MVHRRGFGELDESRPVIIGSLSKAITATAVLQLVDGGKVELDAPMQRYLGETRFADPAAAAITVRQLLNQSSGLPTEAARGAGRDATLAEHVDALREVRLVAVPGERHIYSSPNYQILGRIVELVSGQPFGRFVETRIFSPLGMTASGVDAAAVPRLAPGHNLWWGFSGPSPYRFEGRGLDHQTCASFHWGRPAAADSRIARSRSQGRGAGRGVLLRDGLARGDDGRRAVAVARRCSSLVSRRGCPLPKSRSAVLVLTNSSSLFADHTREIAAGIVTLIEGRPLPPGFRPLRAGSSPSGRGRARLPRAARGKAPGSAVVFFVRSPVAVSSSSPLGRLGPVGGRCCSWGSAGRRRASPASAFPRPPSRGRIVPRHGDGSQASGVRPFFGDTVPFQWRTVPSWPTAQTSEAERPQTPRRLCGIALFICVQAVPSKRRIVPTSPTAKAPPSGSHQTSRRAQETPDGIGSAAPSPSFRIVPRSPTARTSGPLAETPFSEATVPLGTGCHRVPS
ncbi:MAG: beta-lactamase family protein [Holophagales bacterium]|nr:beta-lactamase family protein [Holophagales bacterium]